MPADRPRPSIESFARDTVQFSMPADLIESLRGRAAAEQTTLFTLFVAAFECLLARYSGQDDILLGSVSSGRSRHEFESTMGYFVNTLIFRADFSDGPTFRDLLRVTKADILDTLEHSDFSFPLLVERLRVPRDPSRAPICDADIVWDKSRDAGPWLTTERAEGHASVRMDWFGTTLETYPINQVGAPSDLGVVVFEVGTAISINLGYNTDLFDRSTAESFGRHFVELLRAIAIDPDVRVSQLHFMTADERTRLSSMPQAAPSASHDERALHVRFEAMVSARPDAIAVSGAHGKLTYAELNARANALARHLRTLGVTRGSIVGLRLDRDVHLATGILGILKAGAAYLPIDTSYPESRAEFMLGDSGARAVVTESSLASGAVSDIPHVLVDQLVVESDDRLASQNAHGATDASHVDDLAYVIYTSGSTGQPKGVLVTHRNVARLFDSTRPWFAFDERDVWSLFHSVAFDFSVWEFWGALLHGGRLVVVPFTVSRSPEDFLALLATERVTVLNQTPSAFRQLIAADATSTSPIDLALRFVVFGGEALDVNMLRPWFDRRGDQTPQLVNMYGITETTVHTTYRPIRIADLGRRVRSPIGIAIPDLHLLVLDPAGRPVPVGVPGELYVGGAGVARGYLNRPELTEQRFLPDHTSSDPNARFYRSGDLVRRLPDGDIEYLGRIDLQVKVRGFRIELGEIEAALAKHPSIDHCAVIVRPDASGESRILAYIVLRSGEDPSSAELHAFMKRGLPDYMVPSAFVRLAALPLTNSSKLDVKALPLPDVVESASARVFIAPTNDIERDIATEWQRALAVERVGIDDDFFELGGHSILATGLARWIRSNFQVDFPVHAVFEAPTVGGMARRVMELRESAQLATAATEAREEFDL
jgi:amino acid adenylation domain-containing protein